jgi:hypothetical protein
MNPCTGSQYPGGDANHQVEQERAKRISLSDTRTRMDRVVQARSIVEAELVHSGVP